MEFFALVAKVKSVLVNRYPGLIAGLKRKELEVGKELLYRADLLLGRVDSLMWKISDHLTNLEDYLLLEEKKAMGLVKLDEDPADSCPVPPLTATEVVEPESPVSAEVREGVADAQAEDGSVLESQVKADILADGLAPDVSPEAEGK